MRPVTWFFVGAAAGLAVALLLQDRRTRPYLKGVLKAGMGLYEAVTERIEVMREDVADLVTEARHEREAARAGERVGA